MLSCESINDNLPSHFESSIIKIGDKAPTFEIMSIDNHPLSIPVAKPALLILFSHTCPDCKALLDELQEHLNSDSLLPTIIAISRGGEVEEITSFRDTNGYSIDMAADTESRIYYQYATMYVPRCYLIDSEGIVRFMTYEYTEGDIEQIVNQYNAL